MRSSKTSNGKIHYINGDVYYRCFHQVEKIEKKTITKKGEKPQFFSPESIVFPNACWGTYPIWLAFVFIVWLPETALFKAMVHLVRPEDRCQHQIFTIWTSAMDQPLVNFQKKGLVFQGNLSCFRNKLPGLVNMTKKRWKDPPCYVAG